MDERDPCLRCDYDLRGIPDSRPCPECGLLAGRSRMPTDELRYARPRWLSRISLGVWSILFAKSLVLTYLLILCVLSFRIFRDVELPDWVGSGEFLSLTFIAGGLIFACGVFLVTSREGVVARDRTKCLRRWTLRILSLLPLIPSILFVAELVRRGSILTGYYPRSRYLQIQWSLIISLAMIMPLPVQLTFYLRGLARRVLSRHLLEHCVIVGIGWSVCIVMVEIELINQVVQYFSDLATSYISFLICTMLVMMLFLIWGSYLMVVFAIDFARASREARASWTLADLSASPARENPPAADRARA